MTEIVFEVPRRKSGRGGKGWDGSRSLFTATTILSQQSWNPAAFRAHQEWIIHYSFDATGSYCFPSCLV